MSAERDWERTLREDQYDLPAESWQRMENDMRSWLAAQSRNANASPAVTRAPWWSALLRPSRWGVALAGIALAGIVYHFQAATPDQLVWQPGQQRFFDGPNSSEWAEARCEVQGSQAHITLARLDEQVVQLRLDQGQATFLVKPRRVGETFQVDLTKDCLVQVVGTAFTVGKDSLSAWVTVKEGRVRLQVAGDGQFVDRGGRAQCPSPEESVGQGSATTDSSLKDSGEKVAGGAATHLTVAVPSLVAVPSCNEPGPCVAVLSAFVRKHPDHPAVNEVSLRWGRLAARGGDPRDALVGYSHVRSQILSPIARLEAMQLRVREFGESGPVADSLDRWLSKLKVSDPIWRQVTGLRLEIFRRQGNDSSARRLQEQILEASTAESRGR
ncbi:MAG: FecR domain-containing protein [Fibrobacteres bacterium]|nr:FecR domain-containing protein [Fibrobacterota bacterium]